MFDFLPFVVLCFAFHETYTKIGLMYLISMLESPGSHCAAVRYPLLPHSGNLFPLYPLFLIFVAGSWLVLAMFEVSFEHPRLVDNPWFFLYKLFSISG
ncbi:hypothetical protein U1Q18_037944 [Sarracenia purpurea var. burkii]